MMSERLFEITANSQIFVLTGAGISKESWIQTFRDSDGLWNNHRIEDVASPEGFYRNPTLVYDFYNNGMEYFTYICQFKYYILTGAGIINMFTNYEYYY